MLKSKNNQISKCLKILVFLCLLLITLYIVYKGPVRIALKDETAFKHSFQRLDDFQDILEHEMQLAICREPGIRNLKLYKRMMKQLMSGQIKTIEEMNQRFDDIFFTKPEDWIVQLAAGIDTPTASGRRHDDDIHDFVPTRTFIHDMDMVGFCAEIDLSNLKRYLISKGDISSKEEGPTDFSLIVWLKGSNSTDVEYKFIMYPKGDRMLAGSLLPVHANTLSVDQYKVIYISYKLYSKIRSCNASNESLFKCIQQYVNRKFNGTNAMDFFKRLSALNDLEFSTLFKVYNQTGCQQPCLRLTYSMDEFVNGHTENLFYETFSDVTANSSEKYHNVLYLRHVRSDTVMVDEEFPEFTVESLISDIGGLTGIFLGMSFWSMFDACFNILISRLFS